jgi:hypothetical protein
MAKRKKDKQWSTMKALAWILVGQFRLLQGKDYIMDIVAGFTLAMRISPMHCYFEIE